MAALEEIGVRVLVVGLGEFRRAMGTVRDDIRTTEGTIRGLSGTAATFGQNMVKVGSALIGVGRTMTLALTAPIVATTGLLVNAGIQFEDTFAGISKTVDGIAVGFDEIRDAAQQDLGITVTNMEEAKRAAEQLGMEFGDLTTLGQKVRDEFRQMALAVPLPTNELNRLGEVVGQLGVGAEDIADVTKLVAQLGVATDMAAEDAAFGLLKLFNIVGDEGDDVVDFIQRAGSAIVALGNNSAATESEILGFSLRLAAAGERANFSEQEILAWSTTLADVGARAEAGGTAVSRAMNEMFIAIETGSDSLGTFAAVSKQSAADFAKAFEKDASAAFNKFLGDLKEGIETGRVTKEMLTDMGLGGVRALDIISRLGEAQSRFTENLKTSNQAWAEGIALQEEAEKRFNTVASQIQLLKNAFTDLGITIFDLVKDDIKNFIQSIRNMIDGFKKLDPSVQKGILQFLGFLAILGPVIIAIGGLISILGTAVTAIAGLATPLGLAVGGVAALVATAGSIIGWENVWKGLAGVIRDVANLIGGISIAPPTGTGMGGSNIPTPEAPSPATSSLGVTDQDIASLADEMGITQQAAADLLNTLDDIPPSQIEIRQQTMAFATQVQRAREITAKAFGEEMPVAIEKTHLKLGGLQKLWTGFVDFLDVVFSPAFQAVSDLFRGFGEGFAPFIDEAGPKLQTLFDNLGLLGDKLKPLGEALDKLLAVFGIDSDFEKVGETLGTISGMSFVGLIDLLNALVVMETGNLETTTTLIGLLAANLKLAADNEPAFTQAMLNPIGPLGQLSGILGTIIVQTSGLGAAFTTAGLLASLASGLIQAAFNKAKTTIQGVIDGVKTKLSEFGVNLDTAKGKATEVLNAIGGAFTTLKNKALAALSAVIDKLNALIQAAADAYAAVTGSPELKLQHPFEDFSKFLKKNDFGALAAESLAMPSILTDVTALQSPQQVAGSSTTDNSISIGDINNVPIPNEDVLLDVLVRRIRSGGALP